MIKYIEYDSIDETGQHIIPINTLGEMNKTASGGYSPELMKFILNMKRQPKRYYAVVNALGSYEYWGCNRNGDAFPESGLKHLSLRTDMGTDNDYGYKTFEYYAKFFMHHCFPENVLIKTNNGFLPIRDIQTGDFVFTHSGKYQKVLSTFKRVYNGIVTKIGIVGFASDQIISTPEHPFEIVRRESIICPTVKKSGGKNNCTFYTHNTDHCRICGSSKKEIKSQWVAAKNISVGDYAVITPELINKKSTPKDIAWSTIYGFFISEGSLIRRNNKLIGIQFTFGEKETSLIDRLSKSCHTVGLKLTGPYIHKNNHTATLCISSITIAKLFSEMFGDYSHTRKIPSNLKHRIGFDGVATMLGCIIDGDGHQYVGNHSNGGQIRIRSNSYNLLNDLKDYFYSIGVIANKNIDQPNNRSFGRYTIRPNGVVSISPQYSTFLSKFSSKCQPINHHPKGDSFFYNGKFYHRIREVDKTCRFDNVNVYNLKVECDDSYQIFGINVHNCNKDPARSFGEVVFSYWNPLLHRVELIIAIDTEKAKDIVDALESGNQIMVSMGCRVKYDFCCICGNKAKTRTQYCVHLKNHMREVIDAETAAKWSKELGKNILPGTQVFARNDFPKFFDISRVYIGADRTSYFLGKAANSGLTNLSVDIAEAFGVKDSDIDKIAMSGKKADIDKEIGGSLGPTDIDAIAVPINEKEIKNKAVDEQMQKVISSEPSIPNSVLDSMASSVPLKHILSTLLGLGIHPKPREFQRIVLIQIGEKPLADHLDDNGITFKCDDSTIPDEIDVDKSNFIDSLGRMLVPFLEKRSAFPSFLGQRLGDIEKQSSIEAPLDVSSLPQSSLPVVPALAGIAALYTGLKLRALGYTAKDLAEAFVNKPWLRSIVGGGMLYAIYNRLYKTKPSESPAIYRPASSYANVLQDTNFSGHIKESSMLLSKPGTHYAGNVIGSSIIGGAVGLPLAYIANSYNQKAAETGRRQLPIQNVNPIHASIAGAAISGGGIFAAQNIANRLSKSLSRVRK